MMEIKKIYQKKIDTDDLTVTIEIDENGTLTVYDRYQSRNLSVIPVELIDDVLEVITAYKKGLQQ